MFASVHSLKLINNLTQIRQFSFFSANKKNDSKSLSTQFSHFNNETNEPKQVDISEKSHTNKTRIACASGYIQLNQETFHALVENKLKKGNALIVAQIAGIQASKQTSSLIPLCHTILLDGCDVKFSLDNQKFRIYCETTCKTSESKTGVEMEALTSNAIALLTIYDMCKALQKDASLNEIQLLYKYGGKSDFKRN
jgi:molybdenum cofactor biosynthesis protein MoaC